MSYLNLSRTDLLDVSRISLLHFNSHNRSQICRHFCRTEIGSFDGIIDVLMYRGPPGRFPLGNSREVGRLGGGRAGGAGGQLGSAAGGGLYGRSWSWMSVPGAGGGENLTEIFLTPLYHPKCGSGSVGMPVQLVQVIQGILRIQFPVIIRGCKGMLAGMDGTGMSWLMD